MIKIDFKKPTIEDKDAIKKCLSDSSHFACDYSVSNIILWAKVYNTEIAFINENLIIRFKNKNKYYFSYPMGKGDISSTFTILLDYCKENNIEFSLNIIEPNMFSEIERIFPGEYSISYDRDNFDYVYSTDELSKLSGKKYHGKKNHINKFVKTYENWIYENINADNILECINMVEEWCVENKCCQDKAKADEICVLINGLKNMEKLGLIGGIIRVEDKIVALTMGEELNKNTFVIHFEKAFTNIQGAYTMINQQFIQHELMGYEYVNREEDLGLEGLRKAKESYKPIFMVEKGIVTKRKL